VDNIGNLQSKKKIHINRIDELFNCFDEIKKLWLTNSLTIFLLMVRYSITQSSKKLIATNNEHKFVAAYFTELRLQETFQVSSTFVLGLILGIWVLLSFCLRNLFQKHKS